MPLFQSTTSTVAFKLAVIGPAQAGKRTAVRALQGPLATPALTRSWVLPQTATGTSCEIVWSHLSMPWRSNVGLYVDLYAMAACGRQPTEFARRLVYERADAVLLVADSRSAAVEANLACLSEVRRRASSAPLVVLASRRDATEALSLEELAKHCAVEPGDVVAFGRDDEGAVGRACGVLLERLGCSRCDVTRT